MRECHVRKRENVRSADAERKTPQRPACAALGLLFGAADEAERCLSDVQWVTLWAQIYGTELDGTFGARRD